MLEKFAQAKQAEIKLLQEKLTAGSFPAPLKERPPSFGKALTQRTEPAIIAEYKRASPSKGVINQELTPQQVADFYAQNGASALSVLTEETYFQGSLDFLEPMSGCGLPMLRKDFIIHPLQVRATAATRASALLLIVRMFNSAKELRDLLDLATTLGLEVVTEIFAPQELETAREAGAKIIQVNNRDLDTLQINWKKSLQIKNEIQDDEIWISASGIESNDQYLALQEAGYQALLIGTSLMQAPDPGKKLKQITGAA